MRKVFLIVAFLTLARLGAQAPFERGLAIRSSLQYGLVDEEYQQFLFGAGLEYEKPVERWFSLYARINYRRFIARKERVPYSLELYPTDYVSDRGETIYYSSRIRRFSSYDLALGGRFSQNFKTYRLYLDVGGGFGLLHQRIIAHIPYRNQKANWGYAIPPETIDETHNTLLLQGELGNSFALDRFKKHWFSLFLSYQRQFLVSGIVDPLVEEANHSLFYMGLGVGYQYRFK